MEKTQLITKKSGPVSPNANKKVLRFFAALSDETRLKIVMCLADSGKTVGEIHSCVGQKMTLSAISHQLSYLVDIDIIEFKRRGREKHFRLSDRFCWCILKDAFRHYSRESKCKRCSELGK